jgi:hypothetical protein
MDALGSFSEAFAVGVFAEADDHLLHQIFEAGGSKGRGFGERIHGNSVIG